MYDVYLKNLDVDLILGHFKLVLQLKEDVNPKILDVDLNKYRCEP